MADAKSLLQSIKDTKPSDIVNHPFSFAVGVGAANGLLAVLRGKHINWQTATALGIILGLGEAAINHFESGEKKFTDWQVAWMSVIGVGLGVAPFVTFEHEEGGKSIPIAERSSSEAEASA